MSEKVLNALMRLFAMLANSETSNAPERAIVELFLKKHLNREQVSNYLTVYDSFVEEQKEKFTGDKKRKKLAVNSVKVVIICKQMNAELTRRQKFVLLLNLLEFINSDGIILEQELELVNTVALCFNISSDEFELCYKLSVGNSTAEISDSPNLLIVSESKPTAHEKAKHIVTSSLQGEIGIIQINKIGVFFARYFGSGELFINGQLVVPGKIYTLFHGSSFQNSKIQSIYYSDILGSFFNENKDTNSEFVVKNLEYKFDNQKIGLHKLSFNERSGKIVGIMGGSGAGKSTLLNLLNGNFHPSSGEVLINGYNLHTQKKELEGAIGYVPQDDLLIDELTVYQNLFYNAKLCFANKPESTISKMVLTLLTNIGLAESKNLKVGSPLENIISGGQRKRLNIALELIREPSILFLDEPTSGLSSKDSENILDLLKELTLKGKLVFVVIHQPSSEIFKMFDSLLILDLGGYPVYYGNPVESIVYFKTKLDHINALESECVTCGNVNPEQVFNIIETKVLDENGMQTRDRRILPEEWNDHFNKLPAQTLAANYIPNKSKVKKKINKPNFLKQFKVFATRDVASKIPNKQYLAINLLEAPVLAAILASLIKYYKSDSGYVFFENKNIPVYLFMCVLVALFVGLMVSAEEIFKDRKILKRESFLNLSRGSYLFSKISILFFVSMIQTLLFVLVGNYILEIQNMHLSYWLILFSTSCFANMLGLNISAGFNSVITIYILIPFLLIPQILLSGVLVKFHELNPKIANHFIVPFEGEVMVSRWAFEALAVNQFMNNKFEKKLYPFDKKKSLAEFKKDEWVNQMNKLANDVLYEKSYPSRAAKINKFNILINEIQKENKINPTIKFSNLEQIKTETYDIKIVESIYDYLSNIEKYYIKMYNSADDKREYVLTHDTLYMEAINERKNEIKLENENERISNLVKNTSIDDTRRSLLEGNQILALKDPVFRDGPSNRFIRAHFFAPRKYAFGSFRSTYWVNISVIWFMTFMLAITLYFDMLRKLINFLSTRLNIFKIRKL